MFGTIRSNATQAASDPLREVKRGSPVSPPDTASNKPVLWEGEPLDLLFEAHHPYKGTLAVGVCRTKLVLIDPEWGEGQLLFTHEGPSLSLFFWKRKLRNLEVRFSPSGEHGFLQVPIGDEWHPLRSLLE